MIYLDNASTTWPKPPAVMEAMTRYLTEVGVSPGRGIYAASVEAERSVVDTRRRLAKLFDAPDHDRIVICLNCTDALNMAIKGTLREGDHVVTTTIEHNSVARPLQAMVDSGFITQTKVKADSLGLLDPADFLAAMSSKTRLVICSHASNVLGTIQPVSQIGQLVRERDAVFLVDAAQTAGVLPIAMEREFIDLLAFPGHKSLLGPPGIGGLCVGERANIRPWREGGTGGDSSTPIQPEQFPFLLEAGTPNTVGIVGLGAALAVIDPPATLQHERSLLTQLIDSLADESAIEIQGPPLASARVGALSLTVEGYGPEEVAAILDESYDIAVRGGLHCAPDMHRTINTYPEGTVRVSPCYASKPQEMTKLTHALKEIVA